MSCGCGQPNNDHGDSRNITQNDLNNAAQAAGISPTQAAQNIVNAQASQGSGQSGSYNQPGSYGQPGTYSQTGSASQYTGPGVGPGTSNQSGTSYTGPGSVSGNAGQGPGFGPGISNQTGTSNQTAG
jgi:hypothetical protein